MMHEEDICVAGLWREIMKKNKRMVSVVAAIAAALMLTACTKTVASSASASELVAPETSSEEILASSLEYLLQEGGGELQQITEPVITEPAVMPEETAAEELQGTQVTVYYGNSGSLDLKQEVTAVEELTPESLIDSLAKHNIVSLDTKVNSFEVVENTEGKVLKLDLSKGFREYLKTMTENSEKVILASVTNTFLKAYEAETIQITVDGRPLETTHESYEKPMEFILPEEE